MSNIKVQENKQKIETIEEKQKVKPSSNPISIVVNSFKILFISKFRIERVQATSIQYQLRKKKSIINGWLKSKFTFLGVLLILAIISIAVFGPWIAPYSYEEATGITLNFWNPPSPTHPLGTGQAGRDVLSRIIYGTRYYLVIASISVSISLFIGTFLGMLAGFYGKWVDSIIMRIMDVILAFPGIIFALAYLAIFGTRFSNIVLILGVIGIPYYSRLVRF